MSLIDQLEKNTPIYIENVVATAKLNQKLNLKKLISQMPKVQYKPEKFPGVVMRLTSPKAVILFFSTGNIVCTGATSVQMTKNAFKSFIEILEQYIGKITFSDVKIQNIVSSANLGQKIHLEQAARTLPRSLYEPEQFPGIIHRVHYPKTVILLFASGKLVCTGGKNIEDIKNSIYALKATLQEKELFLE